MKRILLKISGESLSAEGLSIHPEKAKKLAELISQVGDMGKELVIVVGWGNIYRWSSLIEAGLLPADSHNMSTLSTVFNAVTLKNFLEKMNQKVSVYDALWVEFLTRYTPFSARRKLQKGEIVICSSGIGVPFFSTDTAGVIRSLELGCEAMIKLTKVDGVYDKDPMKYDDAKKIDEISYDECITQKLKILDTTALVLARDNNLPVFVSHMDDFSSLEKILRGKKSGTKIS